MGDGCMSGAALTVVDFDGTYIAANSLHVYLLTAMRHHLRRGHIGRCVRIAAALGLRAARLVSHRRMKSMALRAAGRDEALLSEFAKKIEKKVRPEVLAILERQRRKGDTVLLATAAADFYIRRVWTDGNFVATRFDGDHMGEECRGEAKLAAVGKFMAAHGIDRISCVLTDHLDDAPLMRHNAAAGGVNILVAPDSRSLRFFRELEPTQFLLVEELADDAVAL